MNKRVLAVVPVRNDAQSLRTALDALDGQTLGPTHFDVLVVDGMSTDGSLEVGEAWALGRDDASVCSNPRQTIAAALNVALETTRHPVIAKVDTHCVIPPGYLESGLAALDSDPEAMVVGGPMHARGESAWQQAIADAWNSILTSGRAAHRGTGVRVARGVPVPLGMYRRELFDMVGSYDESVGCAEDDALFHECWRHFGHSSTVLLPEMEFAYLPRESLRDVGRQHYRYGRDRVRMSKRYRIRLQGRHLGLALAAGGAAALVIRALARRRPGMLLPLGLAGYGGSLAVVTQMEGYRGVHRARVCVALAAMHATYGVGLLVGFATLPRTHARLTGDARL